MSGGRVVFITGGARGLGAALTAFYLEAGDTVYCASRSGVMPDYAGGQARGKLVCGRLDITDEARCAACLEDALQHFGRIDILIHNASAWLGQRALGTYAPGELAQEVGGTLLGAMQLTNQFAALAHRDDLRQHIVFIASTAGLAGNRENSGSAYAAAKAGIIRFAEMTHENLRGGNTSAHGIIPPNIRTEALAEARAVSPRDIFDSLQYLTAASDNRHVGQIILEADRRTQE